jgi:hypothetical protein
MSQHLPRFLVCGLVVLVTAGGVPAQPLPAPPPSMPALSRYSTPALRYESPWWEKWRRLAVITGACAAASLWRKRRP